MRKGRFTIPTDESFVEGTKAIAEKWGADAVRDCDGTHLPKNAGQFGKVYNTYFVVRGDNDWARKHPEEAQRIFLLSERKLAVGETTEIEIMEGFLADEFAPDYTYADLWQVYDRTVGEEVLRSNWRIDEKSGIVTIENCKEFLTVKGNTASSCTKQKLAFSLGKSFLDDIANICVFLGRRKLLGCWRVGGRYQNIDRRCKENCFSKDTRRKNSYDRNLTLFFSFSCAGVCAVYLGGFCNHLRFEISIFVNIILNYRKIQHRF